MFACVLNEPQNRLDQQVGLAGWLAGWLQVQIYTMIFGKERKNSHEHVALLHRSVVDLTEYRNESAHKSKMNQCSTEKNKRKHKYLIKAVKFEICACFGTSRRRLEIAYFSVATLDFGLNKRLMHKLPRADCVDRTVRRKINANHYSCIMGRWPFNWFFVISMTFSFVF